MNHIDNTVVDSLCSLLRRNRGFTGCISSASTPPVYESLANISTVCQGPVTVTGLNKPCEWIIQRGPEWMIEQEERIITSFPGYQLFRLHYDPASPPECLSRGVGSLTLQRWSDAEEGQLPSKEKAEWSLFFSGAITSLSGWLNAPLWFTSVQEMIFVWSFVCFGLRLKDSSFLIQSFIFLLWAH